MNNAYCVLETIQALLKLKKRCSYNEIAKLSKNSPLEVIKILNANKEFLIQNKVGQIIGLDYRHKITHEFNKGLLYKIGKINYGAAEEIQFIGREKLAEELQKPYWCGGLGDSYSITTILKTPENLERVIKEGLEPFDHRYKTAKIEEFWHTISE